MKKLFLIVSVSILQLGAIPVYATDIPAEIRACLSNTSPSYECNEIQSDIHLAYQAYISNPDISRSAQYYFRSLAIEHDKNKNLALIQLLKNSGHDDAFLKIYRDAIDWAKEHRQKSAEELFQAFKEADEENKIIYSQLFNTKQYNGLLNIRPNQEDKLKTPEFQKLSDAEKIKEISGSFIASTFELYRDRRWEALTDKYVKYELRTQALKTDKFVSEYYIELMKKAGIVEPEFFKTYQDVIDWAEEQKQKSSDELYDLYKEPNFPNEPKLNSVKAGFSRAYLKLSADKGHERAKKELDDYNQRIKKSMQEYDAKMKE